MSNSFAARAERFDRLFENDPDPWRFETSDYEREKRGATLAALGTTRFRRALEIGCATGVLTEELAPRCDTLLAMDISHRALTLADARVGDHSAIRLIEGAAPRDWPGGSFDLIVLSEVLYFMQEAEITTTARLAGDSLRPGGTCLLVNWTGESDLPIEGDEAVRLFANSTEWHCDLRRTCPHYRIDRFIRP